LGSASELEYHLVLALDLGLVSGDLHRQLETEVVDVKRMLSGLARRLVTDGRRQIADG